MEEDEVGDYTKSEVIVAADRATRRQQLEDTLGYIGTYLAARGDKLDAVVVSGDITYYCREEGFKLFESVLAFLGDSRPENDHILVVPGNHDVARGSPHSSKERYALFTRYIRERGFITPLLDGIDIGADGQRLNRDYRPYLLLDDGRVVILGLSSVDYCQVEQLSSDPDLWQDARQALANSTPTTLERFTKAEKQLRYVDIARVSRAQMVAGRSVLQQLRSAGGRSTPVAVAVALHHHLLPITGDEEIKPFESLVNLGAFRKFIRENDIDIVLHGHKHVSSVYWDYVETQSGAREKRVLVCASAAPHRQQQAGNEVCRILTLNTARRFAPEVRITGIPPDRLSDYTWDRNTQLQMLAVSHELSGCLVVDGQTAEEVYQRLVSVLEAKVSHVAFNVICTIQTGRSAAQMPDGYPDLVSGAGRHDDWFNEIVKWWQSANPSILEGYSFRHGERLRRFGGPHTDQIDAVVAVLSAGEGSGKAIATLIDPDRDDITMESNKFPAFSLVQFTTDQTQGETRLNCVGYFRHQEMRAWWPINVAELAYLQRVVLEAVNAKSDGPVQMTAGCITTFTAFAQLAEGTRPRVAVPLVDRTAEDDPLRLWKMVYALAWPQMPQRAEALADWRLMASDWMPQPERYEKYGVPIAKRGLDDLECFLKFFQAINPSQVVETAVGKLRSLSLENADFLRDEHKELKYASWRGRTIALTQELLEVIGSEPDATMTQ